MDGFSFVNSEFEILKYDRNFKEIPMSPSSMDAFFTSDKALWKGTDSFLGTRLKLKEKKIVEVKTFMAEFLTQRQQEVISLYYFNGKTQTDIGVILGIHQTTVSQHLRYGIKKLRIAFK